MLNNSKISIVIPCYNEEIGIKRTLGSIPSFVDEVIVVDNNSHDNSVQIAKSFNARVLIEEKRGYGRALKKGIESAQGDYLVIMDGDGSYSAENLEEIITCMQSERVDFLTGCRFPLKIQGAMPCINLCSNYFVSYLIRLLFRTNITDSQSGMFVFKKNILDKFMPKNLGMGFSQEIKIRALLDSSLKCAEKHIPYYPRIGRVKFRKLRDGIGNFWEVLVLRVRLKNEIAVS